MKATTTRPLLPEERKRLEELLSPTRRAKSAFVPAILVAVPLTFALFALLHAFFPGTAILKLLLALGLGGGAAWFYGTRASARAEESRQLAPEAQAVVRRDLAEGRAAVTRYEAEAVVRVAGDPSHLVRTTWFVKLADGSVVLLVQPDLEEAERAGEFPAASFEIATGESSHFLVSVKRTGEGLVPAMVRAPLSEAEWEELGDEADEPVPLAWDEVLERARLHPPRAKG